MYFWIIRNYMEKTSLSEEYIEIRIRMPHEKLALKAERRLDVTRYILEKFKSQCHEDGKDISVNFSLAELVEGYNSSYLFQTGQAGIEDIEEPCCFWRRPA